MGVRLADGPGRKPRSPAKKTTLYWDDKDGRFVYITPTRIGWRHYKVPKTAHTEADAKAWIKANV